MKTLKQRLATCESEYARLTLRVSNTLARIDRLWLQWRRDRRRLPCLAKRMDKIKAEIVEEMRLSRIERQKLKSPGNGDSSEN